MIALFVKITFLFCRKRNVFNLFIDGLVDIKHGLGKCFC